VWSSYILRVLKPKKIAFVYLANDVIQKSIIKKNKGVLDYKSGFEPAICQVLRTLFDILEE